VWSTVCVGALNVVVVVSVFVQLLNNNNNKQICIAP